MNHVKKIIRSFFKKGQNNFIKISSLGVGMAVAIVLLAKVSFDTQFDDFFPDANHIYQVQSNFKMDKGDEETKTFGRTSGAIAVGMKMEIPQVELATRFANLTEEDAIFKTKDSRKYKAGFILADSCFFKMFPRKIFLGGNPEKLLSRPMTVLLAKSVADKMGNDVIGKTISFEDRPGPEFTVEGVFDDFPLNSHLYGYTAVASLSSIGKFMNDGTMNWLGNDRYLSYVRLQAQANPTCLAAQVRQMQVKYQNIEQLEKENNVHIKYTFEPLTQLHSGTKEVRRMVLILLVVAFSLIFTALLNYSLVAITSLVGKSKEVAVNKCYGASTKNIIVQILVETAIHFFIALAVGTILIFLFKDHIENLLGISVWGLFGLRTCLMLGTLSVLIFLCASIIPSYVLSRIPVTSAFRNYNQSRRKWKQVLLFVQIVGASFLFSFLIVIARQYNLMITENLGYNTRNVYYANLQGISSGKKQLAESKIKQLPNVASVGTATQLLFEKTSGNNVSLIGGTEDLFNIADLYFTDENYLPLMEIPIIAGTNFNKESRENDVIVSKSFAEKMKTLAGSDEVVGKEVMISEHEQCRIAGVYGDFRIGSFMKNETRPSAMFYHAEPSTNLLVKLKNPNRETYKEIQRVLQETIPDKEIYLASYGDSIIDQYSDVKKFRDSIFVGSIVTLLITLLGLIGYLNSEIQRRTSEIAIRKVNGATLADILKLFSREHVFLSPIAILLGCIATVFVAKEWMENFAEKASLSPLIFVGSGLGIFLVIEIVVLANCSKIADQNPVKSLKAK